MKIKLVAPWVEWIAETNIKNSFQRAKIDTGSSLTLTGIKIAELLGNERSFILQQPCVSFTGVSGSIEGHAFKVPCGSIPLGVYQLPVSFIYVPFVTSLIKTGEKTERTVKFITPAKYLIGTDVLNKYQMKTILDKDTNGSLSELSLELLPHDCKLPLNAVKEYSLAQLYSKIDELALIEGAIPKDALPTVFI